MAEASATQTPDKIGRLLTEARDLRRQILNDMDARCEGAT